MEKISVIITTYNRSTLVGEAIESVLAQTKKAAEIIIVDDGSTDNTPDVIGRIQARSALNLVYLRQPNLGPAAARNHGIQQAAHPLLAFLDSDDLWYRKKLELQSQALQAASEHLVSHTMEKWYRRGEHLNQKEKHIPRNGYIFNQCLRLCCVGMSTVMARQELFQKYGLFDESLRCCEDYDLWLRCARFENFLLVDKKLTTKRGGRSDQVSQQYMTGMDRFRIQAIAGLIRKAPLRSEQMNEACTVLLNKCRIYGNGCIKHGKDREGRYYLWLARAIEERVFCR